MDAHSIHASPMVIQAICLLTIRKCRPIIFIGLDYQTYMTTPQRQWIGEGPSTFLNTLYLQLTMVTVTALRDTGRLHTNLCMRHCHIHLFYVKAQCKANVGWNRLIKWLLLYLPIVFTMHAQAMQLFRCLYNGCFYRLCNSACIFVDPVWYRWIPVRVSRWRRWRCWSG